MSRRLSLIFVLGVACDRGAHVAACSDPLGGVWVTPADARWMILDTGGALEAYPMFADAGESTGDLVAAPRVIDLHRDGNGLDGKLVRRYMRRGDVCDARLAFRVTSCSNDELAVVVADPSPPVAFAPCHWLLSPLARSERWRRD